MPKSILIDPAQALAPGKIQFDDIEVNSYANTPAGETERYSREDFLSIWRDMCAIREFETILSQVKLTGAYKGVAYNHLGPAHLSIGQEAAAVGMAMVLPAGRKMVRTVFP